MHPTAEDYAVALERAAEARKLRDDAIRASLAEGKSLRQVAKEFGLSAPFVQEVRDRGE